jgi:hypothetical protein
MLNLLWGAKTSSSRKRSRKSDRLKNSRRPVVEKLEERSLMATSAWVMSGKDGHLIYKAAANGDRIPDFSNAGYCGGDAPLPGGVAVQAVVLPQEGDDGAAIQAAIDAVSNLPLDESGFRGVVELAAGEYQVEGQLNIWASGVILRGAGDGWDGTVLRATGTSQRSLIVVSGSGWREPVAGTQHQLADKYVPVGARSFRLDSTEGLDVGDTIVVHRPSTQAWINAIGMHKLKNPWQPGTKDLVFDRVITRIEGNWITIDAPLTNSLDQRYGGGVVYEYAWPGRIENVGVEHIRGVSVYAWATDEWHSWTFVEIFATQNAWVQDVTTQHFAFAAVSIRSNSKWVTVEDVQCLDPKSKVTGGRRYSFYIEGQQNLVKNAFSRGGRHDFVVGALAAGPNVFVVCWAQNALSDSGTHHRWSVGTLLDNVIVPNNQINIRNRGNSGTGHGWSGANSVIWNSKARSYIVESPPTAQNWLIGSKGGIAGNSMAVGSKPAGIRDSHNKPVTPRSLYYAQLAERRGSPGSEQREYWLGDIDHLASDPGIAEAWTDSGWLAEIGAAAGGAVMGMDQAAKNTWSALSFDFGLAPGEQVLSATLSLGLRATTSNVSSNRVYIDRLDMSATVSQLRWGTIPTKGTTARSIDLTACLNDLQDGRLNVALSNDLAVDWAMLNIQVAPGYDVAPALVPASGDATVRAGNEANLNFGNDAWLSALGPPTVYDPRDSYVSFDLTSLAGNVVHAVVRLPMLASALGVSNSAAIVSEDWDESSITWNNKPASGEAIATWNGAGGQFASIDVTAEVNSLLSQGYTKLSLRIFSAGGSGMITYGSREGDVLTAPHLEVFAV